LIEAEGAKSTGQFVGKRIAVSENTMSWWPKSQKTSEAAEDTLEELAPRSTLLPPPPPGMELDDTPRTMRVPINRDPTLAMIDAALAEDIDIDYDDFAFEDEEDERPTRRRLAACRPASPTLPCRIA